MNLFFQKNHRFLFYSAWLILALAQAASTELLADEAYYWVYSQFPDWGYFDHPPMIAILIRSGYAFFNNESGVRLICVLLGTLTILITESLTERKNPFLFYTIVLSIGVLQIAGFLAVPDTPLLFFTALFFYAYRSFTKKTNWQNALLLGIAITLLFYTKYHGLLIVLFAILSNLKLLGRWQTWLAGFFVLLFYSPHLFWQYQHNWVSFRYHLFESNVSTYKLSYTTDYLFGQLLLAGPLAGLLLLPAAFIYKTKSETEKALKFTLVGIYSIFLLSSFRGKVEVNWPFPALIPLIILSHQFIIDKISWIKSLKIIAFISLILIIAGRIYLVVDIGSDNSVKKRFQGHRSWVKAITERTGETPVVFNNSYQRASLFWFYSGVPSHSHNPYWDRRNNYNFWPTESNLLGKKIFLADVYGIYTFSDSVNTNKGWVGLTLDSSYGALGGIKIIADKNPVTLDEIDTGFFILHISAQMPEKYKSFIKAHPEDQTELIAGFFRGKELIKEFNLKVTAQQMADWKEPFSVWFEEKDFPPIIPDALRFSIKSKNYLPTHNSEKITLLLF